MNDLRVQTYYFFALVAYAIPILGYIYIPGMVGVFAFFQYSLLIITYYLMRKKKLIRKPYIEKKLKYFFCVIIIGVINFLLFGDLGRINVSLMISSILSYFMIIYAFMIEDINGVRNFLKSFLIVLVPTAILSAVKWDGYLHFDSPHIISPLALFFLFCPYFQKKTQILLCVSLFFFIATDISVRACLLTLSFCTFVLVCYYLLTISKFRKVLKTLRLICFIVPLIFVTLGYLGTFNVFQEVENQDVSSFDLGSGRKDSQRSLNTDSRTEVYIDVYESIDSPLEFIFGNGVVINLESSWIETRHSVEAGILNIFLRYGIVGCFFFILLLFNASKVGMYQTNNDLTRLSSLYLSYKFLFMFVEDASIDISTYIAYAICVCYNIRMMDNHEIKAYFFKN